ncbi:MAG: flagellar hook-length control protein FliK [Pseudomonadota bacterium]|nr:flagellar hook-length control protein FliK [Xanthomonadaceae bacterium]MDE3210794.1 flagellar hook-length control protein FliK [Pseudomonadota bacterium]
MIIQPTSLAALTWAGAASGTTAQSWRIGAVLSARPLGISPQGTMVLQVGALAVESAITNTPLPAQFQVRVLSMGAQPLLEVLSPSSPAELTFQRALLERLPQQNGYAPLLATLGALSQRTALRQLPQDLRTALAQLEHAMPTPADVTTGAGLRRAILRSGLFLESELAQAQAPTPGNTAAALGNVADDDWKGALLRLLGVLEQGPPTGTPAARADTPPPLQQRGLQAQARSPLPLQGEGDDVLALLGNLRGDVKAAVARVEVAQLDASTLAAWMIEIPVQGRDGADILQVHLEYLNEGADFAAGWTLGFALDLPALGPVQGELQLREPRLAVRLWASHAEAAQRLERQFIPLRQRLAACGLLLDQLSCQVGLPLPMGKHSAVLLQATA